MRLMWIPVVLMLALAGCTADGSYIGPSRPIDGSFSTPTLDFQGRSSAYKKGDGLPIGYLGEGQEQYSTYSNGCGVGATGLAHEIAGAAGAHNPPPSPAIRAPGGGGSSPPAVR